MLVKRTGKQFTPYEGRLGHSENRTHDLVFVNASV